jgi:hypothetical protein
MGKSEEVGVSGPVLKAAVSLSEAAARCDFWGYWAIFAANSRPKNFQMKDLDGLHRRALQLISCYPVGRSFALLPGVHPVEVAVS